jgi:2-polyprenyl-3-methyl-5-hydroxy-6-metoxy-1,4-benzoquinol methylase
MRDKQFTPTLEVGCSISVLTRLLAPRRTSLLAIDIVETGAGCGKEPMRGYDPCLVRRYPRSKPMAVGQKFDLILFSEILYFLNTADIEEVAEQSTSSLSPNGIILVNYTEQIDAPCTGDQAANTFLAATSDKLFCTSKPECRNSGSTDWNRFKI